MKKTKQMIILFLLSVLLFFIPNISNAAEISVTKNVYSNNGSMKFNFKGLTLDKTHSYEFGLTKAKADQVETWHLIPDSDFTESEATVDVIVTTRDLGEVVKVTDTRIYYNKR